MFIGTYYHILDPKRRVSLPMKMRKLLKKNVIIARGIDKCIFLYAPEAWNTMTETISSDPTKSTENRNLSRFMYTGADQVEIDSLGRILIPEHLCSFADIEDEVALVGVQSRIEIWNSKKWKEYQKMLEKNQDSILTHNHV